MHSFFLFSPLFNVLKGSENKSTFTKTMSVVSFLPTLTILLSLALLWGLSRAACGDDNS